METNPEKVKCCLCRVVMERVNVGIGKYQYKCRNKDCSTYEDE